MNMNSTNRNERGRTPRLRGSLRLLRQAGRADFAKLGWREILREDGANLVEMALSISVFFAMLFGIIEFSLVVYSYTFVSEAAREATRYASIRGANSCTPSPTFPNCNLNPTTTGNPLLAYVESLSYPGLYPSNLTVTPTWYSSSGTVPETWTTVCAASNCNTPGDAVQVKVTYAYPLHLPFWKSGSITLASTSQMMISF